MAIYFIQCGKNGPIKIGKSEDVHVRLAQLQTANPYELKLLWVYTGDEYSEEMIHREFEHERIRGEWFRPSRQLLWFIGNQLSNSTIINLMGGEEVFVLEYQDRVEIETNPAGIKINKKTNRMEILPFFEEVKIGIGCNLPEQNIVRL